MFDRTLNTIRMVFVYVPDIELCDM